MSNNQQTTVKSKILAILLFLPFFMSAQHYSETTEISDFNNDGYLDTLYSQYSFGTVVRHVTLTVTNGKSNEKLIAEYEHFYSRLKNIWIIPPVFLEERNKDFLKLVDEKWFGVKKTELDPSLQWIISANMNSQTLDDNAYFDLVISFPFVWMDGEITLPKRNVLEITGDTLNKLASNYFYQYDSSDNNSKAWLSYYGNQHFGETTTHDTILQFKGRVNNYDIYATWHGLVAKKDNRYSWIFITDSDLTGGPEKLRWKSINALYIADNYIVLPLDIPPTMRQYVYIIDIKNNIIVRMKEATFKKIDIEENNMLIYEHYGVFTKYDLNDIFNEIGKLKK